MKFEDRTKDILLIKRGGFDLYEEKTDRVLNFPFSLNVVNALEIINPGEFRNQIRAFLQTNKFLSADLLIILSAEILFEKDIVNQDENIQSQETQKFLDIVPFESINTKLVPMDKSVRVIAVNKNLVDSLKSCFEEMNVLVQGIVPYEILGEPYSGITSLTLEPARILVKQFDALKGGSFDFEKNKKQEITPVPAVNEDKPKTNKTRLYIMVGVFGVLLVTLFLLIALNR